MNFKDFVKLIWAFDSSGICADYDVKISAEGTNDIEQIVINLSKGTICIYGVKS